MTLFEQIKIDLQNFYYYFFDFPELSSNDESEIDLLINNKLHRPDEYYSVYWKAYRWQIFDSSDCNCLSDSSKKIIVSIVVKPKFGNHISESHRATWCPNCNHLEIKKEIDID